MVHLVHVFLLEPDTRGLVNEHHILVFVVNHAGHVVHVHILEQDNNVEHVDGVAGAGDSTLSGVLNVHIVVVVTVTEVLEIPITTILELFGDLEPTPLLRDPVE